MCNELNFTNECETPFLWKCQNTSDATSRLNRFKQNLTALTLPPNLMLIIPLFWTANCLWITEYILLASAHRYYPEVAYLGLLSRILFALWPGTIVFALNNIARSVSASFYQDISVISFDDAHARPSLFRCLHFHA